MITGTLTFSEPLGDNLTNSSEIPESFSFSDGVQTLDNENSGISGALLLSTNNQGNIIQWLIVIDTETETQRISTENYSLQGVGNIEDAATNDIDTNLGGFNLNDPGTWEVSSVPEPSMLPLLGAVLLGLVFLGRRRRGMFALAEQIADRVVRRIVEQLRDEG
jgi:hypothetical protein